MNKMMLIICLLATSLWACNNANTSKNEASTEGHAHDQEGDASSDIASGNQFGTKIDAKNAISIDNMISELSTKDSLVTKIYGTVESVCQVKGCWMNVIPDGGSADDAVFVKFKDYGFFMPLDLAGKKVAMEGVAFREVTSVDELKHYAEDEGLSKEEIDKITEPKEELKFMANGVIIL